MPNIRGFTIFSLALVCCLLTGGSGLLRALDADQPKDGAAPKPSKSATVTTRPASPLGTTGMTVNGSIHPHGLHTTFYFEYGLTTAYGAKTASAALPPRLAAFYRESFDGGPGGWSGGLAGGKLIHHPQGGAVGGFVRSSEPDADDHNHDSGIGTVHLSTYVYPGPWGKLANKPSLQLAAGDPDLRDAKVSLHVRGHDWVPNGTELQWWTQSQSNIEVLAGPGFRNANWAYTGFSLADFLASGKWEKVEYTLRNDSHDWTYAGNNIAQTNPLRYSYWQINDAQGHLNVDFFHMVTYVDPRQPPKGSIDYDELQIAYRNYSLLLPSNGGQLFSSPKSPDDAATLTEGWRHGKGRMWRSAAGPDGPLDFVYSFKDPVTIRAVQLHQNPDWPAKDVVVLTSADGQTFTPLLKKVLPEKGVPNANFAFTLDTRLSAPAKFLKVQITSGYKKEHWGLGEIEVFGTGATMLPDDDLYNVNLDIKDLKPGATYHYRVVATNGAGTTHGDDLTFTVPADSRPHVVTGSASRITGTSAKVQGRLTAMGLKTQFFFEYGPDTGYGAKTAPADGGLTITPRTSFATLTGLKPGTTYHYRLVGVNEKGTTHGGDAIFTTAAK